MHCLVRARDDAAALSRVRQAADRYELALRSADRVVPLAGDLAEPRLGLSDKAFRDLARGVDVIYHAGALVNFIYPYQELRAANVAGTREVIRLAGLYRGIPVHYVSTTAVLAGLGVAGTRKVTEETPLATPSCCAWDMSRRSTWRKNSCGPRAARAFPWPSTGRLTSSAACIPAPGALRPRWPR